MKIIYSSSLLFTLLLLVMVFPAETIADTVKVYPQNDAMAQLYDEEGISDWSEARNYAGIVTREPIQFGTGGNAGTINVKSDKFFKGTYRIYRVSKIFDLSDIPQGANITSAELFLYKTFANTEGADPVVVTSHQRADTDIMQKQDWNIDNFGEKEFARNVIAGPSRYVNFDFNQEGLSYLTSKIGEVATVGLLTSYDFENVEPPSIAVAAGWHEVEKEGTEFDPYLEITYELPEEPESEYSLYTQIESPYPSATETAAWADDIYAKGRGALGSNPCGATIAQCGCAITSLVMAAQNAGIDTSIIETDVNPGTVNAYLESVDGYNAVGSVFWIAFQAFVGSFDDNGKVQSRFAEFSSASNNVTTALNTKLAVPGAYAVLGFKNGHFVWLPERTTDTYIVRDPVWYLTETSNDTVAEGVVNVRDYNDTFDSARFIEITDEPKSLAKHNVEAYVTGTAELLYENVAGEQVGLGSDGVVVDLASAWYEAATPVSLQGVGETDSKHLLVQSDEGVFTLEVIGTDEGTYTLELFTINEAGEIQTYDFSGQTYPGVTTTFTFDLETGEVVEEVVDLETFQTILDVILAGESKQNQKFFKKWANKIFKGFDTKTVSQSLQEIAVYKKLFFAKKIEPAKWINAVELLEDRLDQE